MTSPSSAETWHTRRHAEAAVAMTNDQAVHLREPLLTAQRIAVAVGGGIAATEAVKLIRMLRRYGADVRVYASSAALQFITPTALQWASAAPVTQRAAGNAEHLLTADLLIVAPATLNLITKAALGIADTLITTLIASALGRMAAERAAPQAQQAKLPQTRILMVPSMHDWLAAHPRRREYKQTLSALGVHWVMPLAAEGKWKAPAPVQVALAAMHAVAVPAAHAVNKQRILITAGAVPTYIDSVQMLTNIGSGFTGRALAAYAYAWGADVTLLIAAAQARSAAPLSDPAQSAAQSAPSDDEQLTTLKEVPFKRIAFHDYHTYCKQIFAELNNAAASGNPYTMGIFSAAVSDYTVKNFTAGKLSATALKTLTLVPTGKLVTEVRKQHAALKVVAFKLLAGLSKDELIAQAKVLLSKHDYAAVVANRLEDVSPQSSAAPAPLTSTPPASAEDKEAQPFNNGQKLVRYVITRSGTERVTDNYTLANWLLQAVSAGNA